MDRSELILRYTISHSHCDTTIVGTCNPKHLTENVDSVAKGPLPTGLYQQIAARVASVGN
jgi:aryl-alcohol dehydrogenase-like predicted oxidoreductase